MSGIYPNPDWTRLPDALLEQIFEHVRDSPADSAAINAVCTAWSKPFKRSLKRIAPLTSCGPFEHFPSIEEVDFLSRNGEPLSPGDLARAVKVLHRTLRCIRATGRTARPHSTAWADMFAHCKTLVDLKLRDMGLLDRDLGDIVRCLPQLEHLSVSRNAFLRGEFLSSLGSLVNLHSLNIGHCGLHIGDKEVRALKGLSSLRCLNLTSVMFGGTPADLSALFRALVNLRQLCLRSNKWFDNTYLHALARSPAAGAMKELDLSGTSLGLFPTSYWSCLASFTSLRVLRLAWLPLASSQDVDAMAGALWKLPRLDDLDLENTQFINSATLRIILAACGPHLRRLVLGTVPRYSLAATQMALGLDAEEPRTQPALLPLLAELTLGDADALRLVTALLSAAGSPHPTLRALRLKPGLARGSLSIDQLGLLLRCLPKLRVLDLPECGACDVDDLKQLERLDELEVLVLRNYRACSSTGSGCALGGLPGSLPRFPDLSVGLQMLRSLTLRGWTVSLEELGALPQLSSLTLENCEFLCKAAPMVSSPSTSVRTLTIKLAVDAKVPLTALAAAFPGTRFLTLQRTEPGCQPICSQLAVLFPELRCLKIET